MAKLYKAKRAGDSHACYFASETEARLIMGAGARLAVVELDELELRQAAAKWLTTSATKQAAAKKREANKTAKQRSDNMRKAWATRKKANAS